MKLSKREIIMLTFLILIALVFIEFRFIITPGLEKYEQLLSEQSAISAEVDRVKLNIATLEAQQKKLKENIAEINLLAKPYFDEIKTDILLNYTREIVLRNGLTLFVYTPNPTQVVKLQLPDVQLQENLYKLKELARQYNMPEGSDSEEPVAPDDNAVDPTLADDIELFKVTLSGAGTYDQIKSLLTDIHDQKRSIRVNDMTLNVGEMPESININVTLEYYGLDKLNEDRTDQLENWPRESFDGGIDNPYPVKPLPDETTEETVETTP